MTADSLLTLASYSVEGERLDLEPIDPAALDADVIRKFAQRLESLSGDLDLPLETALPDVADQLIYQICSDKRYAAYTVFYHHDRAILASLYISGQAEEAERELMQVFKYLLLESDIDEDEDDEPDEATMLAILEADEFDFAAVEQRPVIYQIRLEQETDSDLPFLGTLHQLDLHLGAAFLGVPASTTN